MLLTVDIIGVASAASASTSFINGLSGALSTLLNEIVSNSDLEEREFHLMFVINREIKHSLKLS